MYGVVFADRPVPDVAGGLYFEVVVDEIRQGQEDGLVIGVAFFYRVPLGTPRLGLGVLG